MISNITIGSKVICADKSECTLTAVIAEPQSHNLTHVAVVEKSLLHGEERLVPVNRVSKTTRDSVYLDCTLEDILKMEPFTRTHYLEYDQGDESYAYSLPYMTTSPDMMLAPHPGYQTVKDRLIPEGGVSIQRGMLVEALDGMVGQVGEMLIDPKTGQITHFLLMKGHGWGKKELAIQVPLIDRIEGETIHLNVEKAKIDQLPSLPVKRNWNEVYATDLELMVWIFKDKDSAQRTYQLAQELGKQYKIELLNTTVIEKNNKGEINLREQKKTPSKGKIALGIALGGLAGWVIGPVALVAGAIAGGAAGKRSAQKIEVGFSADKLSKLNENLVPGGSALILLAEHRWFNTLQLELAKSGGQFIHERLADVTYDELMAKVSAGDEEE